MRKMMDKELDMLSDTGAISCNLVSTTESLADNSQAQLDTLAKKAVHLRFALEKDFKACDIKWSMFVASAFSFRYESCLKPFPPAFLKNGVKDMDELLRVITDVPALDLVLQQLINLDDLSKVSDIIHLLFYILVRLKEPDLRTISLESHDQILELVQSNQTGQKPQYIFQVLNSPKSSAEQKWKDLAKGHNVFYAYHGTHLENFYSMLCFSVQQHLNKSTVLGNGMYLTSDLSASLSHSRGGFGWGASCIGGHLSCVAMCEVIDAPEGINYQKTSDNKEGYSGDSASGYERAKKDSSPGSSACHYIITNSDLVRLRYILVYAKQPAFMRFPTTRGNRNEAGLRQWFSRHKLFSILLGYGIMLATIGFANNQPLHSYYQMLLNKLEIVYSGTKIL